MKTERFEYLDSVRGIACMIVVFLHFFCYFNKDYFYWIKINPFNILVAGNTAVCIFFILSGFVLSYKFIGESNNKWKIIEAVIKRPIRLNGIILATGWAYFTAPFSIDFWYKDYDIIIHYFYSVITYILSALGIWHPGTIDVDIVLNPPLWTIQSELTGSFIIFGICLLIGNIPKIIRLLLLIGLLLYLKDTFYIAFIFGIIIADFHKNWNFNYFIKNKNMWSWILFIPAIIIFSYPEYLVHDKQYWINIKFIQGGYSMLGALMIFIFVMWNNKIKIIFIFRPLIFIGGISYSIYVLHQLIMPSRINSIFIFVNKNIMNNLYFSVIISILISTFIIIVVSCLIHYCIDKPCIKFSSWFSQKIIKEIHLFLIRIKHMQRFR